MCGRYTLFTDQEQKDLYNIIREVEEKLNRRGLPETGINKGEIYPTNLAPVFIAEKDVVAPEAAFWGFPNLSGKGVIINARGETAAEKRMFAQSFATMRCVVPSAGFYEWDGQKNKYRFREPGQELLYMAGIIRIFQQERRFVILTTAANTSMQEIHHRMPVIVKKDEIDRYLWDESFARYVLTRIPVPLVRTAETAEYGQLSFYS